MGKRRLAAKLAAIGAGAAILAAPFSATNAYAQNTSNGQLMGGGLMSKFSAQDVSAMLADFEIQTALAEYSGEESATMLAQTSGGARFIVSLLACDELSTAQGCQRAIVFTALSNAGFAYADLNEFNMGADVTKAINLAEQNIVLFGTPIYSGGGIGRENFKLLTALFLNDMQNFSEAQSASAAEVSFGKEPEARDKLSNIGGGAAAAASSLRVDASMIGHATTIAVSNTWKSNFLTEEISSALE